MPTKEWCETHPEYIEKLRARMSNPEHQAKLRAKVKEKYGVENVFLLESMQAHIKELNVERYGVENVSQSQEVKRKKVTRCQEKYGKDHYYQTEEFKNKQKQTNLDKYGVEYHTQVETVKEKRKISTLEKYGVESFLCIPEIRNKGREKVIENKRLKWIPLERIIVENGNTKTGGAIAATLGISTSKACRVLRNNNVPLPSGSCITVPEQQIIDLLESQFPKLEFKIHDRTILKPKEIDILIPSLNLGIEVNGSYWHQDDPENYKYNKYLLAKEKGIDLLHLDCKNKLSKQQLSIVHQLFEVSA